MSDLTGRRVEPWEVAFFNGAAILDVIPVHTRDEHQEQVAFRGGSFRMSSAAAAAAAAGKDESEVGIHRMWTCNVTYHTAMRIIQHFPKVKQRFSEQLSLFYERHQRTF